MGEEIRILILEDEPADAQLMEHELIDYGIVFSSLLVKNRAEFAEALTCYKPDLILADYSLPDLDGLQALKIAWEKAPLTPFILVSGAIGEEKAIEVMKSGATDFVLKQNLAKIGPAASHALEEAERRREQSRMQITLHESENLYRRIFENARTALLIVQGDTSIAMANPEAENLLGLSREDLEGKKSWMDFVAAEDADRVRRYHSLHRDNPNAAPESYEFQLVDADQNKKDVLARADLIPGTRKSVVSLLDITKRKKMEEALRSVSLRDDLTGLHNRRGFFLLAAQQLKLALRSYRAAVLIFADLDRMKWINDKFGHLAGDRALRDVAQIFNSTFRESDVTGRIGGDEFVALALETVGSNGESIIKRLQANLSEHNRQRSQPIEISLSVGVSHYDPDEPFSIEELIDKADETMYQQKITKKENIKNEMNNISLPNNEEDGHTEKQTLINY